MGRLKGKTVLITGASSGLGVEMARQAAQEGASLILLARRLDRLKKVKEEIGRTLPVDIQIHSVDVSRKEEVEYVFGQIIEKVPAIDILVNNAGFGVFNEAHEAKWEETEAMFKVNVLGLIACTQMVIPHMKARRSGHIINIASQAGKMATPKSSIYAATKHAVLGYTNSLRMELARDGVHVTAVNPGPIATEFFTTADPSGSYARSVERWMLKPEQVAREVIRAMGTQKREINLPRWMNAGSILHTLFPGTVERLGRKAFFKK
ncbi:SDR family NAD(P)-dependent oxidoreductase [Bacillus thermotolerans]|uniref:Oxidoreductase, short-chain dehydrogenase/reductase family n=1 Tax=Bacillus thermotolerans TaxID=1221996 RepID=A0A0F5HVD6_BACTR|nr:SDR family oxidoreductase [Bacillus thermotolerans]KKB36215.1 Oxidoreductase [Bacillus thermotolerans]KKB37203.1 Oxidoreductase, short-chain dehydrogenase/reductase family [Bacillus thermotolerans]KKB42841.1 Oxidoreductase, short-chain dehydrogenase/reductase family [Bacillus thermotolerans]